MIVLISGLNSLQGKKQILNQIKTETIEAMDQPWKVELANLQAQVNTLSTQLNETNEKLSSATTRVEINDYITLESGYTLQQDSYMIVSGNIVELQLVILANQTMDTTVSTQIATLTKYRLAKPIITSVNYSSSIWSGVKGIDYAYLGIDGRILAANYINNNNRYLRYHVTYIAR